MLEARVEAMNPSLPHTVVLGGGIAGLEALMALADLAAGRTELTLVAPDPDFHLKPMVVEEPFTSEPAERRELAPMVEGLGAKLVRGAVAEVVPTPRAVELVDQSRLRYEFLVVCVGGRARGAYRVRPRCARSVRRSASTGFSPRRRSTSRSGSRWSSRQA